MDSRMKASWDLYEMIEAFMTVGSVFCLHSIYCSNANYVSINNLIFSFSF